MDITAFNIMTAGSNGRAKVCKLFNLYITLHPYVLHYASKIFIRCTGQSRLNETSTIGQHKPKTLDSSICLNHGTVV